MAGEGAPNPCEGAAEPNAGAAAGTPNEVVDCPNPVDGALAVGAGDPNALVGVVPAGAPKGVEVAAPNGDVPAG